MEVFNDLDWLYSPCTCSMKKKDKQWLVEQVLYLAKPRAFMSMLKITPKYVCERGNLCNQI